MQSVRNSFQTVVCPLLTDSNRFNVTVQTIPESDPKHRVLSLITFLSGKLAESACHYVRMSPFYA